MAKFSCKTRNQSSPQGKPRVYFCAHPADHALYLEQISKEILSYQNCAVWYDEEPASEGDENFFVDLGQMQLFVIPITAAFLAGNNRAMDVEFAFATERHIPILPLLQDPDLVDEFNRKCGDLQFLNKYDPDPSALPYEQKLERYLSGVLVGDELAEKIRAAFDAYIFLSYRKKDRKYAQELMRLIHKNEFCRDIAIWYDEFLTPGEDFKQSIEDAMQKSRLFALAVTPNLINEENYVMNVEYPMAVETGKPILPAQVVPTDKKKLKDKFDGIADPTDAYNPAELSAALSEALHALAIKENDTSPEHNFFIGLAYLSGVDVEVDYERAVSLITFAAEAGLPEALEKLVSMYNKGEGVARNYDTALHWHRKLAEARKKEYYENPTENTALNYKSVLWDLGDDYVKMYRLEDAQEIYTQFNAFAKQIAETTDYAWAKRNVAVSYNKLGRVADRNNDLDTAERYFRSALAIYREISKEKNTISANRDLTVACNNMGSLMVRRDKLSEAEVFYTEAFTIYKRHADRDPKPEYRATLASAYVNLGSIFFKRGEYEKALEHYSEALKIRQKLYDEDDSLDNVERMMSSHVNMGTVLRRMNRHHEAKDHFALSLQQCKQIAEAMDTPGSWINLTNAYIRLGQVYLGLNQLKETEENYTEALVLARRICQQYGTPNTWRVLSSVLESMGNLANERENLDKAESYYKEQLEIDLRLLKSSPTLQARRDVSCAHNKLGKLKEVRNDLDGALQSYLGALAIREGIAKTSETSLSIVDLGTSHRMIGNLYVKKRDLDSAEQHFQIALTVLSDYIQKHYSASIEYDLAITLGYLGNIASQRNRLEEAVRYQTRKLEIVKRQLEASPTTTLQNSYQATCDALGNLASKQGNLDEAEKYFKEELAVCLQMDREGSTPSTRNSLGAAYERMGDLACKRGNWAEAESYYDTETDIYLKLAEASPTPGNLRSVAICFERRAKTAKQKKEYDEALKWYGKEEDIVRDLLRQAETPTLLRHLSAVLRMQSGVLEKMSRPDDIVLKLEEALQLDLKLLSIARTVEVCNDLAGDYCQLAEVYTKKKDYEKALHYAQKRIDIREQLLLQDKSSSARQNLGSAHRARGLILQEIKNHTVAKTCFEASLKIDLELVEENRSVSLLNSLASDYYNLMNTEDALGNKEKAEEYARLRVSIREEQAAESPTPVLQRQLSAAYDSLGKYLVKRGQTEEALIYYKRATELDKRLMEDSPTVQSVTNTIIGLKSQIDLEESRKNLDRVCELYAERLTLRRKLVNIDADTERQLYNLAIDLNNAASSEADRNNYRTAYEMLTESLQIKEAQLPTHNTPDRERSVSLTLNSLGNAAKNLGNRDEARDLFRRSVEIRARLNRNNPTEKTQDDLAIALYYLGNVSDPTSAKDYYVQARDLWTDLSYKYPQNRSYDRRKAMAERALKNLQ